MNVCRSINLCLWILLAWYAQAQAQEADLRNAVPVSLGEPEIPLSIDTDQNRQVVFRYDRDGDGEVDTIVLRAQQEFIPVGTPCADYDPQYMLVPVAGYYRVRTEPNRILHCRDTACRRLPAAEELAPPGLQGVP